MESELIRVVVVDADPGKGDALPARMEKPPEIQVVGTASNRNAAIAAVESLQPDVLVVDLMLPGLRSIDLVRHVNDTQPNVRILTVSPDEPPHDRVMLATQSGALGFVGRHATASEYEAAIRQVHRGEPWLPLRQTYEVLQDGAGELAVSAEERRARLGQVVLGLIPLTGLIAAITSYLWREYWGAIGVRVADLGIDPASRMIDVLVVFVVMIGILGPTLFVRPLMEVLTGWIEGRPGLVKVIASVHSLHIGKLPVGKILFNRWIAWLLLVLLVLGTMLVLARVMPLIMVLVVGPGVGIILVANVLDLDDELPGPLQLLHLDDWRALALLGIVLLAVLIELGVEVLIVGPDLRPDGLHGILAPAVLGFGAKPVMLYDLDEKQEPLGALYLGGNADLYVLYDPCLETVRFVPVGSSRVELIDKVTCRSP